MSDIKTRSQALATIADGTSLQQLWGHETSLVT